MPDRLQKGDLLTMPMQWGREQGLEAFPGNQAKSGRKSQKIQKKKATGSFMENMMKKEPTGYLS